MKLSVALRADELTIAIDGKEKTCLLRSPLDDRFARRSRFEGGGNQPTGGLLEDRLAE